MSTDKTDENEKSDPQTYRIIGAAMEAHRVLGNGFLEQVYQEALAEEFEERGIPFSRKCGLSIIKHHPLKSAAICANLRKSAQICG